MLRRYSIHIIASKGRYFAAGEAIPDDVVTPGCAERYRIVDEQPDDSSSTTVDHDDRARDQPEP